MSSPAPPAPPSITSVGPFAVRGRLVRGPEDAREAAVVVDHGVVVAIDSPVVPGRLPRRCLDAAFVAPGFVDLQVNGGFGWEVGGDPGALRALAQRLPATGVTTFLPTLISAREEDYRRAFAAFRSATAAAAAAAAIAAAPGNCGDPPGARMPAMHLEGPLLAVTRAGAHEVAPIEAATAAMLERLVDPLVVGLVTLAPERAGALPLIAALVARGVLTSLGHTDAPFDTFIQGVDAGATLATHLFNAMSPFHHRHPGATGAALVDDRITALLIADGVHCHPAAFRLAAQVKGTGRLALVTDAIAAAGLPPGPSTLAGRPVRVTETSARLEAGGTDEGPLAGSILTMDRAVRNAATFAGVPAATALSWASQVPARALGLAAAGRLAVGDPADIVLLDERLFVEATFIGGVLAHSSAADHAHARALMD